MHEIAGSDAQGMLRGAVVPTRCAVGLAVMRKCGKSKRTFRGPTGLRNTLSLSVRRSDRL